jgi:ferric-dicitrate binding protein FerR (iron transport regulator)
MKRLLIAAAATLFSVQAVPAMAAEGLPGATVRSDSGKASGERQARYQQWCQDNPEKCREVKAKIEEGRKQCEANPEKCRAEREARFEEQFKKADANGDGALSRAEAEKGMPWLARHFDAIDANKDGLVTREEIAAARKARASVRKDKAG